MSVKIAHTGDWHIDSITHGANNPKTGVNKAIESHLAAGRSVVEACLADKPDAFLFVGDAFAHGQPAQESILLLAETLMPLMKEGIPIVLIGGNHERLRVPTSQRTATDTLGELLGPHGEVHVVERAPRLVRLNNGIQVAGLPWLSKTSVLARLGIEQDDPEHGDRAVVQYALDELEKMCDAADTSSPLVLASHVTVEDVRIDNVAKGHKRGSEVEMAPLFNEPVLPRKALEASPVSYAALSHIHTRQRIGTKCFYAGAPDRFTFTDADDPKSFNMVTVGNNNTLDDVTQIATNARAMHSIVLDSPQAAQRLAELEEGALVETVLPPGEGAVPDDILQMIADAGAVVAKKKSTPLEVVNSGAVILPETVSPKEALRTWLGEKYPDRDVDSVLNAASRLIEEVSE